MLTKEQKDSIMNLYGRGLNISEIGRKVGVSRHSVYRVIQSDFEEDPEIHALKKKLEKVKLQKSIREQRKPFIAESKMNEFERAIDELTSKVLLLWKACPDYKSDVQFCPYCREEVIHHEKNDKFWHECSGCKKIFD